MAVSIAQKFPDASPSLRNGPRPTTVRGVFGDDKVINAAARRVLTGLWVDITQVHVSTTRGTVRISGHLQRMTATHAELAEGNLVEMDRRLRSLPGVRGVQYVLDNWQQTLQGQWIARGQTPAPAPAAPPPAAES
jgi:hypothetical protein